MIMVWMHHVPSLVPKFFDGFLWHKDREEQLIYLTFDDGPVPGVTDFVLNELEKRGMKATFFMVGDNLRKHPELGREIFNAGHRFGNHTYHHLDGYQNRTKKYLEDISLCEKIQEEVFGKCSNLFRPPYGRIKPKAHRALKEKYQIVMWDVLSGDYDAEQPAEVCLDKTIQYSQNGSIVVFHDQQKSEAILKKVLPEYLDFLLNSPLKTATL